MKHNLKITLILVSMFILTQLIGLYVVNFYLNSANELPYGFNEQAKEIQKTPGFYSQFLISTLISFVIAIFLIFFLMKSRSVILLKAWFFIVIALGIGITLSVFTKQLNFIYPTLIALGIGIILAYFKVIRRNIIVHNLTELIIYPGIAAIFITMLNIWTIIILLIIISLYDLWAVWKSGIMQKMVKFQINSLGVLGGFLIPYADRKMKDKIKLLKLKYKNKDIPQSVIKKNNIRVQLAILGGGDVVFPIIATGVFLKTYNSIAASLIITLFALLALLYLFFLAKKKKSYPAMPYLTAGIFIGMIVSKLFIL